MPSSMEKLFADIYGIRQQKNEDRQDYFNRLITKVNDTSDEDWERLTDDAGKWFNKAVKPWAARKAVPEFPDATDDVEHTDNEEHDQSELPDNDEAEDTVSTAKKKKRTGGSKKAASAKSRSSTAKKKTTGVKATTGALEPSGSSVVKRAMLRNMRATPQELQEVLKKKGMKLSPVRLSIVRSEFRHSIRLLQEDEKLKDRFTV